MNANTSRCNRQRIDDFLNSDHIGLGGAQLVDHLDSCAACRQYMESQAADSESWSTAAEMLQPGEFDHAGTAEYSAATIGHQRIERPIVIQSGSRSPTSAFVHGKGGRRVVARECTRRVDDCCGSQDECCGEKYYPRLHSSFLRSFMSSPSPGDRCTLALD